MDREDYRRGPAVTPEAQAWADLLPAEVRRQVRPTQAVIGLVSRAVQRGWTVKHLAQRCSEGIATARNAGGVVTTRLQWASENDPPRPQVATFVQPLPWCGQCDEQTRWAHTEVDEPVRRCTCWTPPPRSTQ